MRRIIIMKKYLSILLLLISCAVSSQDLNITYNIESVFSDLFYYNSVVVNDKLFVGTDLGVYVYDSNKKEFNLFDPSITGYIKNNRNIITKGKIEVDNVYSHLLPKSNKDTQSNHVIFNSKIVVISKGNLFVFNDNYLKLYDFASVRTISENYIGTYEGIYDKTKGDYLEFPSFTNSYIREFENYTFINWDGLSILKNNEQYDLFDSLSINLKIDNKNLGFAYDVAKLNYKKFILTTSKGLYELNINEGKVLKLQDKINGNFSIDKVDYKNDEIVRIIINDDNNIYKYIPNINRLSVVKTFNEKIVDLYLNDLGEVYVLLENNLKYFDNLDKMDKFSLVGENINNPHNVGEFKNYIYVTTNSGLSLFNTKTNQFKQNLIKDEFNKKAHYTDLKRLHLGSVNGLYVLEYDDLNRLFLKRKNEAKSQSIIVEKNNLIIGGGIFLLIIVLITQVYLKNKLSKNIPNTYINEKEIKRYIDDNLASVSVKSICSKYKISLNKLYAVMGNQKPGDYINKQRINLIKQLIKESYSVAEISQKTGFSISYLNQILKKQLQSSTLK